MGCPQPGGSLSSRLLDMAAAERVFSGAATEAAGAGADGWRGAQCLGIGMEGEALYLGKREQEGSPAGWAVPTGRQGRIPTHTAARAACEGQAPPGEQEQGTRNAGQLQPGKQGSTQTGAGCIQAAPHAARNALL